MFEEKNYELWHGDCLELMKKIPDESIDMILTDPPYGTTKCKWDSVIPFEPMWKELNRVIKPNGAIALFGSEPFSSTLRMSNIRNYKYDWKWNKTVGGSPLVNKYRPAGIFEDVMVFSYNKNKINYFPIMEQAKKENIRPLSSVKQKSDLWTSIPSGEFKPSKHYDKTKRYPKNEIIISSRTAECNPLHRLHPTQKPIILLEYLINTYTQENETVLDFTMGSGSTGVACINTNRKFIGIELDDKYFDIAKERIENTEVNKQ